MDSTEHIAFFDDLTPEQSDRLRRLLEDDRSAAELFESWRSVRAVIRADLRSSMVDPETFALFVIDESGRDAGLTSEERRRIREAAPIIRRALRRRSAVAAIADDIQSDANAFEAMWDEWFAPGVDQEVRTHRPSQREPARRERSRVRQRSRTRRWAVRVGIGAAVVMFTVLLVLVGRRDVTTVTVTTASGEVRVVELGRGSTVRMMGGSQLSYVPPEAASPLDRQAEFRGHGFFDIAPSDKGYVVKTPNAQAAVLGTSFGVRALDGETEVVLAEGRLTLSARGIPGRAIVLVPGQMSRVEGANVPTSPVDVVVHDRLHWTGLFVFHAAPLEDIIEQLTRFYEVEIVADEPLLKERITGRFSQEQQLDDILRTIGAAIGAEVDRDGGVFGISGR